MTTEYTLKYPTQNIKTLNIRRMTVGDRFRTKDIQNELEHEIQMVANLTDHTQDDILQLDNSDYFAVVNIINAFTDLPA
ncbi:phage tail assembly protein [Piscirickettsia litoralis]|uniref:Phage tail assembly protein n=1 Tax=Piscirickettsia litoralis TaxID=1891921 RepID=A0ABX2ZX08_9GAMM|nr:phage tail assembly protein [Piscirickettsia litoralis]ODN41157.1 hypothetical protein BGC07_17950 [Piscirickettsia litoralis]